VDPNADWVSLVIADAKTSTPVADGVSDYVRAKLSGPMAERTLRPAELTTLALELIELATTTQSGNEP
jgi:hypothetical protein